MAKRCPTCGMVYSDNTQFCDQDATPLPDPLMTQVASGGGVRPLSSRKPMLVFLLVAVVVLVAAIGGAYFFSERHLQSGITVRLEGISLPRSPDSQNSGALSRFLQGVVGTAQAAMGNGDLVARLKIGNGTHFSGEVISASYTIHAGDRQIGVGSWTADPAAPVKFQPEQEVALNLPFRPDPSNTLSSGLDAMIGRDVPVTMQGAMQVKALFLTFTVPINARLVRQGEAPVGFINGATPETAAF